MDSNNERIPEADAVDDWRSRLQPDARQEKVKKIVGTLERCLPFSGPEVLQQLNQIAVSFEEKTYSAATSQSNYLQRISNKMFVVESKFKGAVLDALPSNPASVSTNQHDPVSSQNLQFQIRNQSQSVPTKLPQADAHPPQMDGGDWRLQLQSGSRQRIIDKIVVTLEGCLPFSGPEVLQQINQIALSFEEETYSAATSQSNYLQRISNKMFAVESKFKGAVLDALPSNPASVSTNQHDPESSLHLLAAVSAQVHNQSQCASADVIDL